MQESCILKIQRQKSHYVTQTGIRLLILLSQPSEYWDMCQHIRLIVFLFLIHMPHLLFTV